MPITITMQAKKDSKLDELFARPTMEIAACVVAASGDVWTATDDVGSIYASADRGSSWQMVR